MQTKQGKKVNTKWNKHLRQQQEKKQTNNRNKAKQTNKRQTK